MLCIKKCNASNVFTYTCTSIHMCQLMNMQYIIKPKDSLTRKLALTKDACTCAGSWPWRAVATSVQGQVRVGLERGGSRGPIGEAAAYFGRINQTTPRKGPAMCHGRNTSFTEQVDLRGLPGIGLAIHLP